MLGAVLATVALIGGLALAVGVVRSPTALAARKERLARHGIAVTAGGSFRKGGSRGTDMLRISYEYAGVPHEGSIPCAGPTGCADPPGPMSVRVGPHRPGEFLADNGHTDDSASRHSWPVLVFGLVLALGGGALGTGVVAYRVQSRRAAAPGAGPP
ncbi:MAG TPA: hypothetical protein VNV66_02590, partial [Pilimelia sp.]|nr:hypothetical protein [Pilimelia sp.]